MSITLGSESFRSQAAARERASEILHQHVLHVPITGADADFAAALLNQHPRALDKRGVGVDHFEVRPSPDGRTRNLWVVRLDGTSDNYSIKECVAGAARRTADVCSTRRPGGGA
ncbi:DCL family protein [Janibacter terrae]|uniref:DCL family protein n=1 Tax=Janibacter terrae TaxID=103817 RepID=UPI0031F9ABAC